MRSEVALPSAYPRVEACIDQAAEFAQALLRQIRSQVHETCPEVTQALALALAAAPAARGHFEAFASSKQRDYLEVVLEAKRPEIRAKRIAQSIEWLAQGKARHWKYEAC